MSILSIPQVFEPLGPMRSKRRDFSSQTPLLHYPPSITGFKYLFQIFDSVMALHRIYREHQVSESLHSFFAVKFMVHTSLKKILEVPKATLDTRKKKYNHPFHRIRMDKLVWMLKVSSNIYKTLNLW